MNAVWAQLNSIKCPENAIANVLYQKLGWARTKRKAEEPHKTSIQKQINYSDGIGNRIN